MSFEDIQLVSEIINGILNPDNTMRNASIKKLEELRQNTPALIICLFKIMKEIPSNQTRFIASVLISNLLRIKEHEISNLNWENLPKPDREQIRNISLEILKNEKDKKLKMKYCNLIHIIFDNSYETSEPFEGVLDYVYKSLPLEINETNLLEIETALELLSSNFTYLDSEFMKIIDDFLGNFRNFFKTSIISLKTKTVRTISEIINYCDTDKLNIFNEFILNILETTLRALENFDKCENELKECLKALNEISSSEPTLLIKHFSDLYILMSKVIEKTDYMDEKIRELAFDVITNTVERSPKLFSKDHNTLKHFFEQLYKYALEIETDIPNEWLNPNMDNYKEDETSEEKIKTAFSIVYRLNECLTSKIVLSQIQQMIEKLFSVNEKDFRYVYVALMSILEIVTLVDEDISLLENISPIVYKQTLNENPKIRYAAISCIKVFNICFGYNYKKNYHETFINVLLENIEKNEKVLRNQLEIINALIAFYEDCPIKIGKLYMERILETFIQLFLNLDVSYNVSNLLRRKILKLLTKLISNAKENIAPYAEKILNILLELFNNFYVHKTNSELYGDFLECIVLVGPYAKNVYFASLPDLMNLILQVQNNISVASDPIRNSLEFVYKNFIPVLKDNDQFKILIPEVIKSILILVKNLPTMSISSNPESEFNIDNILNDQEADDGSSIIKSIQTSSTEDITSAVKLLKTAVKSLKDDYIPYIELTQKEIFELINYKINENVRIESVKILHHIVDIIMKFSTKENLTKITKEYLSRVIDSIEKEFDNTAMLTKIKHLGKIVLKAEYFLTREELNAFFKKLTSLIDEIELRRLKLVKEHNKLKSKKQEKENLKNINNNKTEDDEYEEEDAHDPEQIFKDEIQEIEDIQGYISDVIGFSFKTHKDISHDVVECIIKEWLPKYFKENTSNFEIKMGILIIDDMIEFLGQNFIGNTLWNEMASILIKYTVFPECKIRRAANYGVGILAQNTVHDFSLYSDKAIELLANSLQIQIENRNELEWGGAKDNATASIGKILKYQSNHINLENCFFLWIRNLPIIYDETESIEQHGLLCDFVLSKPEFSLGSEFINLDQILRIFSKIYGTPSFSDESIDEKIRNIISSWKQNLAITQSIENIKNSSEPTMKKKINKLLQLN